MTREGIAYRKARSTIIAGNARRSGRPPGYTPAMLRCAWRNCGALIFDRDPILVEHLRERHGCAVESGEEAREHFELTGEVPDRKIGRRIS